MKKIGILGGTFNPPHLGHLLIGNEVKHALGLDEVRLMPNAAPPHKTAPGDATAYQRLHMANLAAMDVEGLTVSSYEVERGGISYTYDTVRELIEIEPDVEFYFIIGGDMIDALPTWYRIEELVKLVKFVGVNRPGYEGQTEFPLTTVTIPQIDLSSTLIRNRFEEGDTVRFLLAPAVEAFIRKEGLYGSRKTEK
ncbi:nicotinate-nucleotide adenylyltransferase [Sporosarcina sp. G11-34]|uniref:nicotinate-nucleotide adenylyltransferase n=1 Tax=Sporosarcina sp. G11-34 TaxID=2849605 RepID=UPI0022A8D6A7|nr:nicotinate-nucleotide adenylyltransferase [Sporosarcina sp. G11-34]MCZ2259387.1 nicotinate-nucleotide adenylyltransferase [Sporosarcina sp. G11-34]